MPTMLLFPPILLLLSNAALTHCQLHAIDVLDSVSMPIGLKSCLLSPIMSRIHLLFRSMVIYFSTYRSLLIWGAHCQRRILGIKWSDFITNAEVYIRSGLQSIQSIVHRRRLSLFGHVARMPDNVPTKAVLRMACDVRDGVPPFPNWRRPRGRPPTTWLHQICSSDCGLSAGDALNCAQDRAVWRTYARPRQPHVDDDETFY